MFDFDFVMMCFNNKNDNGEMQKRLMEYFYDYMDIYVFRTMGVIFFSMFFFFKRDSQNGRSGKFKIIDK